MLSSRPELWPRTSPVTLLKARICVVGGGSGYHWRLSRFGVWAPIWGHVCIRGSHCHWGHAYLDDPECSRADPYPSSAMWRHAWGKNALSPSPLAIYGRQESCFRASRVVELVLSLTGGWEQVLYLTWGTHWSCWQGISRVNWSCGQETRRGAHATFLLCYVVAWVG